MVSTKIPTSLAEIVNMRQKLLSEGAKELSYEIREIVKKAEQLKKLGLDRDGDD